MTEPTTQQSKAFYEEWYRRRSDAKNIDQLCRLQAIQQCLRPLRLKACRILDLGCGSGWLANALSIYGTVTAIDLSDEAIRQARQRYPHIHFQAGNLFETPLEGAFDVVVASEVLEHFSDADQQRLMQLIDDHLRPGGYVILTTPNQPVVEQFGIEEAHGHAEGILQPIENHLTGRQLRALIASRFEPVRFRTALFFQPVMRRHRVLNWLRYVLYCRLQALAIVENLLSPSAGGTYLCCLAQKMPAAQEPR